jgi:hypothetical protein
MTEAEWLTCTDPQKMLEFLRGKASDRKLQLLEVACYRRIRPLITEAHIREVMEAHCVAYATVQDKDTVWLACQATLTAVCSVGHALSFQGTSKDEFAAAYDAESAAQAALLRDIFGPLPFRLVSLNSAWHTWKDATIPKLAQAIYDDRAFDSLPVLADALEEAGCTDSEILSHCRGPGPHVPGCRVVDTILGKT